LVTRPTMLRRINGLLTGLTASSVIFVASKWRPRALAQIS